MRLLAALTNAALIPSQPGVFQARNTFQREDGRSLGGVWGMFHSNDLLFPCQAGIKITLMHAHTNGLRNNIRILFFTLI